MTKKIVSLLMVFVLVLALTACTTSTEAPADEPSAEATAAPEAQEPAAEDPAAETPAAESGSPAKPVPEEGAVLHFMHIYPEHANAIEKSLEIIQRDNPGMEINVSVVPWNEATKSIQTAAATDEMAYSVPEVERLARIGFEMAKKRRGKLCPVDKANVLACSPLWRHTGEPLSPAYPEV